MRPFRTVALLGACFVAACAGGAGTLVVPSPAEVPDLEASVSENPGDGGSALLLASAYREAGRTADAQAVVDAALAAGADSATLTVMAGVLHEDAGDLSAARAAYASFLALAPRGDLRAEVAQRLDHVRRLELQSDVRAALAREREVADRAPDPSTVGVFPFAYEGTDEGWAPLGTALAELLITDLATTGRLRVLERVQIQTLVDELALSEAGLVEEGTAARGGRLLGSGRVVQGRYRIEGDQRLSVGAAVVSVTRESESVRAINASADVTRLFDLEKQLALDLFAEMGVELTAAERARVNERQTESIQALLAFGEGLQAWDRGDFGAAEGSFARAAELDPGFAMAQARRTQASVAGGGGARRLAGGANRLAQRRRAVQALRQAPGALRRSILHGVGQRQRSALAEVLGQDRLGSALLLELVFRRPGGGP